MIKRVVNFVKTDIWRLRLKNYPPQKSWFIRQLRIIILAVRGYMEDNCKFRASALTFFTALSIVPTVVVIFAVASGFGLKEKVEELITEAFERPSKVEMQIEPGLEGQEEVETQAEPVLQGQGEVVTQAEEPYGGQEEAARMIIELANKALSNEDLRTGVFGGIAIGFFFWTIIKVLSNVENSFNEIWGIKRGRHIGRRFADYLSIVLVCPILIVIATITTVAASDQIEQWLLQLPYAEKFGGVFSWVLHLTGYVSYVLIWIVFTFLLMFMPNTKVRFKSGVFAGIVTGTLFVIIQAVYVNFQIGVRNAGMVYGSLATPALFLIWMHVSWLIVLFGAELAFAHQNVDTYEFEQDCLKASYSFRRLSSLVIAQRLIDNFTHSKPPSSAEDLSHYLEMPIRLVRDLLFELVDADIVSEVYSKKGRRVIGYQPGQDVNKLTVKFVIDALEKRGVSDIPIPKTDEMDCLKKCLRIMNEQAAKSEGNALLKAISLPE